MTDKKTNFNKLKKIHLNINYGKVAAITGFLAALVSLIAFFIPKHETYKLHNVAVGATLVNTKPKLTSTDNKQVCLAPSGTIIELVGEPIKGELVISWQQVKIESGTCEGKNGWVSVENIIKE